VVKVAGEHALDALGATSETTLMLMLARSIWRTRSVRFGGAHAARRRRAGRRGEAVGELVGVVVVGQCEGGVE
jgi:hypothetical protein